MSEFNYYKSKEVYREKYYQMPKVFFTNEKYMGLSNDAKIAYMLLKDRFEYSVANNWVDKDDNIYFIYTISELMNLLNCREGKISKIKKELEKVDLLRQKKGRINRADGSLKTTPNLLYLGKAEVSATDVFKISEAESCVPNLHSDNDSTVTAKNANTVKPINTNDYTVTAKNADNLLYSNKSFDTNRHLLDTEKDLLQDRLLLDNFVEIMTDDSIATFIPARILMLIKNFSSSYAEAQQTVRTIHNAKSSAQEETEIHVVFEDLEIYGINGEQKLYNTLLKAYQKRKTEKVENMQSLIFIYVKNWFVEYPCAAIRHAQSSNKLPEVSLFNWMDDKM